MSANCSRDDCLNHVVDRVAGGLTDFDIDCQYNFIKLQAEDIMKSLVLPDSWTLNMKEGSTPILSGFQQQIDNWRLVTYLQRRVEYRSELIIPRSPRWTDTTPALAAQIRRPQIYTLTCISQSQTHIGQVLAQLQLSQGIQISRGKQRRSKMPPSATEPTLSNTGSGSAKRNLSQGHTGAISR